MNKTKLVYTAALVLLTLATAQSTGTRYARSKIELVYQGQPNGDYKLYLFGSDRTLVCEEKNITIAQQGDAINPVVIECKH
jgi:hypothetical protein